MSGNEREREPERPVPTNGWSEWRYYVLEKLKDQQETIEQLRKENTDLHLSVQLMREQKLEKRHEELKKRVAALAETADALNGTVDILKEERKELQQERRDKTREARKLWLAVIQGFVAIVIALFSFMEKGCSAADKDPKKAPSAAPAVVAPADPSDAK